MCVYTYVHNIYIYIYMYIWMFFIFSLYFLLSFCARDILNKAYAKLGHVDKELFVAVAKAADMKMHDFKA